MKKFASNFSQQKKDLNAEWKKTAALEQGLREMESALSAGIDRNCDVLPLIIDA